MISRLKQYVLIGAVIGFFYFLLSNHFIFFSVQDFERLKKNELTFKHTFSSVKQVSPEVILRVTELREAGLGDLMVQRGMLDAEKLQQILLKIEARQ
jgi:hypothetical protein